MVHFEALMLMLLLKVQFLMLKIKNQINVKIKNILIICKLKIDQMTFVNFCYLEGLINKKYTF